MPLWPAPPMPRFAPITVSAGGAFSSKPECLFLRNHDKLGPLPLPNGDSIEPRDGAHFGSFSAIASKKIGPTGKVIAFEPNPEIYPRLARNIAINSLDNVVLHNEAVSGEDGKLVLFLQQRSSLATTYPKVDLEDRVSQSTRSVTVPARSMRSILRSIGGPVDLLKIDCEGAEYDIFDGLGQENISCVRQIAVEVHKIPGRYEQEIVAKLSALEFTVRGEPPMIAAFKAA
jgi:FkbM family methyltransferase